MQYFSEQNRGIAIPIVLILHLLYLLFRIGYNRCRLRNKIRQTHLYPMFTIILLIVSLGYLLEILKIKHDSCYEKQRMCIDTASLR